ncbi:MAG: carbamoyltransferase HypF [Deltaproteobacteria bacterium]|nr:MAG: carbamoyltransferase HypF [Deltaproteobacteria bacterium]
MQKERSAKEARRLSVRGIVQGVGFRPFVYQLATALNLKGQVANTSNGVTIFLEGPLDGIESFLQRLTTQSPPLAHITRVDAEPLAPTGYSDFSICQSREEPQRLTMISPDVSICNDCKNELFDPGDRRYGYPFINCTNCGPRYTIIDDIPYDRPKTSMRHFRMCPECQAEYDDPFNRRFHAQPNACPVCGPQVVLHDREKKRIETRNPIETTISLLKAGHVVAVKGLGGFHLVVDAENETAVETLRQRKHREEKPLAVMSGDIEIVRQFALLGQENEVLLQSRQRPIVLLEKKNDYALARGVSPKNRTVGVMLPYTPLHYLLVKDHFTALVMTSGNLSEEPIAINNTDAFDRLRDIADYFLVHDRDIYLRSDDSVVRIVDNKQRFLRRSRGYVPAPIFLKSRLKPIIACGAELKNTVCLTRGEHAFLSQHIGDLENLATYEFFEMTIAHLKRILSIEPEIIAHDMHPDYLSTRYAMEQNRMMRIEVQHHHAHIVSCMAENHVEEPVIGLSFDGTGYGSDGTIWGGEVLIARLDRFERAAHLAHTPMPGGAAAIKEPWRMAVSYLYGAYGKDFFNRRLPFLGKLNQSKLNILVEMIEKDFNSPGTSSLGRFFDGIAAMVGIRSHVAFEGQAAMELEMVAEASSGDLYEYAWSSEDTIQIDPRPITTGVVMDIEKGVTPSVVSGKFHATLMAMFADLCVVIRKETGISHVALSGGCFQNAILLSGLSKCLHDKGFHVLTHEKVPANDGGIALGQAVIADAIARRTG